VKSSGALTILSIKVGPKIAESWLEQSVYATP
jgi:hypothetical protein